MADELKLKPKHPKFLPFLGAYVEHKETFDNKKLFKVAFCGPLLGGLLGIISFYIDLIFKSTFFHQIALYSLILNFANLIPYAILDGGHIVQSLQLNKLNLLTTLVLIIIAIVSKKYIIIIIGLLGLINYLYISSIKDKKRPMNKEDREFGAFLYIGLILILGIHSYIIIIK
jgi:Zn-dependent protease